MCYLLPILDKLMKIGANAKDSILSDPVKLKRRFRRFSGGVHRFEPDAIIFLPTRELTLQVAEIIRKLAKGSDIRCCAFFKDTLTRNGTFRYERSQASKSRLINQNIAIFIICYLLQCYNVTML